MLLVLHPSQQSRSVQKGLKHDSELQWVPKVRIVFEKRDKIRSNGVFRMKYLLVLDISMVESCLLSFMAGKAGGCCHRNAQVVGCGFPAAGAALDFKEPEMVKEQLLCQPITANALCCIFMCGYHSASAHFLPCTFSNNSYGNKSKINCRNISAS